MTENKNRPGHKETQALSKASSPNLATSLDSFNQPLAHYLGGLGLPTTAVLAPIEHRRTVIENLAQALEVLPHEKRKTAQYLSRFAVAISVGLFDGALNYLWNETVQALRRLLIRTDLSYFYAVASKINSRYGRLKTEDDMAEVSEHDLLEACRRIGLLTDTNYQRLAHVNYMRNHASAAHPNGNDLDGFEILSWLSNCLRYAIVSEPDHSVVTIKRLLASIRTETIPSDDYPSIGSDVAKLGPAQIDDLVWAIFGMYVDPNASPQVLTNIEGIAERVWAAATEDRRHEIGARVGSYRANGEASRKAKAETFLQKVDGLAYRDLDSLASEMIARLEALKTAHFGGNNFYNEHPHAELLGRSLPVTGEVPRSARPLWVKVLVICYVGNGLGYREGTDEHAAPIYAKHIKAFGDNEIAQFLHLFGDPEFVTDFGLATPDRRLRRVVEALKGRTDNVFLVRALETLEQLPFGRLASATRDSKFQKALNEVEKPA